MMQLMNVAEVQPQTTSPHFHMLFEYRNQHKWHLLSSAVFAAALPKFAM
jgi:hypothetical protein